MNINTIDREQRDEFKLMNFNHLMQIYENNYYLINKSFEALIKTNRLATFMVDQNLLQYEPISVTKYTTIFKLYYKYRNTGSSLSEYSIKPHIIFTLYKDAKMLEAKSLVQQKIFDFNIDNKLRINLNIYYWLKNILTKSHKYQ